MPNQNKESPPVDPPPSSGQCLSSIALRTQRRHLEYFTGWKNSRTEP